MATTCAVVAELPRDARHPDPDDQRDAAYADRGPGHGCGADDYLAKDISDPETGVARPLVLADQGSADEVRAERDKLDTVLRTSTSRVICDRTTPFSSRARRSCNSCGCRGSSRRCGPWTRFLDALAVPAEVRHAAAGRRQRARESERCADG